MAMSTLFARIHTAPSRVAVVWSIALSVWSCGGADASGPPESPLTVALSASANRLTAPGDITLSAAATGTSGASIQKVEFYEQIIGIDPNPRKTGEDLDAPYEMTRTVSTPAENGDIGFTARMYDAGGHSGTSNQVMVTVAIISDNTPLQATVPAPPTRITTPGRLNFTISANKAISRAELYNGTTRVAEITNPTAPYVLSLPVTQANNGTQAYVVKVYDFVGQVVESAPMSVDVDIRWDFVHTFNDISSTRNWFVATDATNSVYLTGPTAPPYDLVLIKQDAAGHELWRRTFGGPNWEYPNSIGVDASGRIYISGSIYVSGNLTQGSCFLTLYDAAGSLIRTQQISGSSITNAEGCTAAADESGNFYVVGHTAEPTDGHKFVLKYDRDGALIWSRKFGGQAFPASEFPTDEVAGITVDSFGGIYVSGYTGLSFDGAPNRGPRDGFVLKFDVDGNRVWSRQYGTAGVLTFGDGIAPDPDGGVFVVGSTDDANNRFYNSNGFVQRYGSDGVLSWTRTIDGGRTDNMYRVVADRNGVNVVGETYVGDSSHDITEPRQGSFDALLTRFSRDGERLFVRLLGTRDSDFATDVAIGVNGDVYVSGGFMYDQSATLHHPFLARHRDVTP
ncbi:MAG: SBBP repeat-containing protein [Gemmatimonadaceae bacterium]